MILISKSPHSPKAHNWGSDLILTILLLKFQSWSSFPFSAHPVRFDTIDPACKHTHKPGTLSDKPCQLAIYYFIKTFKCAAGGIERKLFGRPLTTFTPSNVLDSKYTPCKLKEEERWLIHLQCNVWIKA